jgi:rhodanese-related sulfurtransferase
VYKLAKGKIMKARSFRILCLVVVLVVGIDSYLLAHTDVTPEEAKDMIDSNDQLVVLDVREESEYCNTAGHIPEALNYPWNSDVLQEMYSEVELDAEILVVCRSGSRSNPAALFLDSKGYAYVYDMTGGMLAWQWETEDCSLPWGTPASVIGVEDQSSSETANCLLLVLLPVGAVLLLKKRRR